jgi:hypothetical protein
MKKPTLIQIEVIHWFLTGIPTWKRGDNACYRDIWLELGNKYSCYLLDDFVQALSGIDLGNCFNDDWNPSIHFPLLQEVLNNHGI